MVTNRMRREKIIEPRKSNVDYMIKRRIEMIRESMMSNVKGRESASRGNRYCVRT